MVFTKVVRGAGCAVALAVAGALAQGYFTPIVNDFSTTISPFSLNTVQGEAALDNTQFSSTPSSMRLSDLRPGNDTTAGVQAGFWTGTAFPTEPITFSCMLLDTSFGPDHSGANKIDMHFNVGILTDATHGWYTWLGLYPLYQSTFAEGWALGFQDEVIGIGSMRNPWESASDPTFQQRYDSQIATWGQSFPLALTLLIEVEGGTIWIDDLSVTMPETRVREPLVVNRGARQAAGTTLTVMPNGRLVRNSAQELSAHSVLLKLQNGQAVAEAALGR